VPRSIRRSFTCGPWVKRGVGGVGQLHSHAGAALLAVVADFALLVAQRLRAQNSWLQSISPRATASSSFSSALVRRRPGRRPGCRCTRALTRARQNSCFGDS
jgi:hypothetical protein